MDHCKYKNVAVYRSKKNKYYAMEKGKTFWLSKGNMVDCDCMCPGAARDLEVEGIAETMTWRGTFDMHF